jgi:aspartate dehydrogenase
LTSAGRKRLRVGLVGAGVMGSMIARAIDSGTCPETDLTAINDIDQSRAEKLTRQLGSAPVCLSHDALIERSDLVVEAAGPDALTGLLPAVVAHGKDLLVLSVGGLIGCEEQLERARDRHTRVYCPSGAIAGLDGVRAAALGQIEGASITTRKPPAGLRGAPYFAERNLDPMSIRDPVTVFEGSAREACRLFPANINVSAALSLAGIGVDETKVTIIADPGSKRNVHEVEVWGDFGRIETRTENVPSENPRTSRLAALSAIALIRRLSSSFQVGS